MPPLISIIIPTFEREQVLCNTLEYLFVQTYPRLEILVVDQTPQHTPATEAFLQAAVNAGRLRLISSALPSLTRARNTGIEQAHGEIILFCDDDVILGLEWAAYHAENYSDPTIGGVTGQVLEPGQTPMNTKPVGRMTCGGRLVENFNSTQRMEVQHIKGGNMSFRKEVAYRAGLFDTRFANPALLEETDFAFRVRRLGYRIIFDPRATLRHLAWPVGGTATRTYDSVSYYYHFLRSKTLFFMKNMPRWKLPCFILNAWGRAAVTGVIQSHSVKAFYRLAVQAIWDGYCLYRQN